MKTQMALGRHGARSAHRYGGLLGHSGFRMPADARELLSSAGLGADTPFRGMKRDPYEVLGVPRGRRRDRDQEGVPQARARAAPGREQPRSGGRGEVQGGRRGLRDPLATPSAARSTTATGTRGSARAASSRGFAGFGSFADIFDAFFGGGDPFGSSSAAAAAAYRAATWRCRSRFRSREAARGADVEVEYDAVGHLRALPRQRRRAGHADRDLRALRRRRAAARGLAHRLRPARALPRLRRLRRGGQDPRAPCAECAGRGREAVRNGAHVQIPPGIADEQRIRLTGRGHAGERAGRPGDLYVLVRVAADERFVRDGNDLVTVVDLPAPAAALGTTITRAHARRRGGARGRARHPARHGAHAARQGHAVAAAAAAAATSAWW